MGTYRLLLAIIVAMSHMEVTFFGYNPGVSAVISFFVISGFVMTALIERNFSTLKQVPAFYVDRALRLYPQFIFYFVISCAILSVSIADNPYAKGLTAENIVLSLAIVPLAFWMYDITSVTILPPAWSLGLECLFYIVIPFLVVLNLRKSAFVASFFVFCAAFFSYIHADFWAYRLLPGVLFMFLCGSYLYNRGSGVLLVVGVTILALFCCVAIQFAVLPQGIWNTEITAGIAIGVPVVHFLSKIKSNKIDKFLGDISYGVFLNHFVVMYAFWAMGYSGFTPVFIASVIVLSIVCSIFSYRYVERPALKWRHARRERNRAKVALALGE